MALLIVLLIRAAIYLIMGSVILNMIGQMLRPRWINHPLIQLVIALGVALYLPFRRLMQRLGIPTRPLDFSPMVAILSLEALQWLVTVILH